MFDFKKMTRLKQFVAILCMLFLTMVDGQPEPEYALTGVDDAKKAYEWIFADYDADEATIGPHKIRNSWAKPGGAD